MIHHLGRDTTKDFRGSSDVKGSIDVGYKLTNLGDGQRLSLLELRAFKQRFAVTPLLYVRYPDGVFIEDKREATKTAQERLVDLLRQHSGVTGDEFETLAAERALGRNRARTFLRDGKQSGRIQVTTGGNNRQLHTWSSGAEPQIPLGGSS